MILGCGNTVYGEMPGVVSSPNYPGEYDVNQNCFNIIYVEKPLPLLTITFVHMNIEECCDWVEASTRFLRLLISVMLTFIIH